MDHYSIILVFWPDILFEGQGGGPCILWENDCSCDADFLAVPAVSHPNLQYIST